MTSERLYIDVRLLTVDGGKNDTVWPVYGPFASRKRAERCMIALAARPDVLQAQLRDPNIPGVGDVR